MALKPGPVPLYHQIVEDLRDQLARKRLKPGDALPTEEQLCVRYGVSRITVRRAVDDLIVQGQVQRRRGVGTFVAEPHAASRSVSLVGSLLETLAYPKGMTVEALGQAEKSGPSRITECLGLKPGAKLVEWRILSRVGGTPFAATTFYFPTDIGRQLALEDLRAGKTVARLVERAISEAVVRAEQLVEPVSIDAALSASLELPQRTAVLHVLRTYFSASGRAVECASVHYRPDQYSLRVELLPPGPGSSR